MSRVRTITRRSFIVLSTAVFGGVVFGSLMIRRAGNRVSLNPLRGALPEGAATFNPWVKIDRERITLITPHGEMGQGIISTQAALIAEEMDLNFGQFEVEFGQPSEAYRNVAAIELGGLLNDGDGFLEGVLNDLSSAVNTLLPIQTTGASTSVQDSYEKLRVAGAVARETLKLAASQTAGVPVEELTTKDGAVVLPDDHAIKYTDLAEVAASIEPVRDVNLRPKKEWRIIGKKTQALDDLAKATGALKFGIDVDLDDMIHAAIKTNPRRGGSMLAFDASSATTMRGVIRVLEVSGGVAVLADNSWRAFKALDSIQFEWAPAPYPSEQRDHWKALEDSFDGEFLDDRWRDDGDVDRAITDDEPMLAEYRMPYLAHAPLEPLNAIVLVTDNQVEVWSGHQSPTSARQIIASVTGHEVESVVFHNQYMGGSFGHRLETEYLRHAAEIANQHMGTPIKLTYSRNEDFAQEFLRPISISRCRGLVKGGRVSTVDIDIASPSIAQSQLGRMGIASNAPDPQIVAGASDSPLNIEHFRVTAYRTNELAPITCWRSNGASNAGFVLNTFFDELCVSKGLDPLEQRLKLVDHEPSRKVLDAVAAMSGWGQELPQDRGRGIAFVVCRGVPVAEVVEISHTLDGIQIDKVFVACDVGTIIDPKRFECLVQGSVVFGLGHAMNCEISISDGAVEQRSYKDHEGMRIHQCPEIYVRGLENGSRVKGIGEPAVPPAAPALGNAIFDATGVRLRELPFRKHFDFV